MSRIASFVPPEPEPEKPKTLDEQIAIYRIDYRNLLKRTATVLTLPLRKTKAVLNASLTK